MNIQHLTLFWWTNWRTRIYAAKEYPQDRDSYCRSAVEAQVQYVTYLALEKWKSKETA